MGCDCQLSACWTLLSHFIFDLPLTGQIQCQESDATRLASLQVKPHLKSCFMCMYSHTLSSQFLAWIDIKWNVSYLRGVTHISIWEQRLLKFLTNAWTEWRETFLTVLCSCSMRESCPASRKAQTSTMRPSWWPLTHCPEDTQTVSLVETFQDGGAQSQTSVSRWLSSCFLHLFFLVVFLILSPALCLYSACWPSGVMVFSPLFALDCWS